MRIFLMGSSGLVGRAVADELQSHSEQPELVSFTRRRLDGIGGLQKVSDLSDLKVEMEGLNAERAFCALGTTIRKAGSREAFEAIDLVLPLRFAVAAREHGVEDFHIVTALGSDPNSKTFYLRTKGLLERELQRLGFRSLHIYRPSLLVGDREELRLGEAMAITVYRGLERFYPKALDRVRPIEVPMLARFIVRKLMENSPGTHVWENPSMLKG